jgi:hypothetical protein
MEYVAGNQVKVFSGGCRSDDDTTDIDLASETTITMPTHLDTGSEASNTWYYVWVMYNPSTQNTIVRFSASSTSPTLPSGYTKKRRIGSVRNSPSSNFLRFRTIGAKERKTFYTETYNLTNVLFGGSATSWADVDCSAIVPPTSRMAGMWYLIAMSTVGRALVVMRENGIPGASLPHITHAIMQYADNQGTCGELQITLDSAQKVEYFVSTANTFFSVYIRFYEEEI